MFEAESAVTKVLNLRRNQGYSVSEFVPLSRASKTKINGIKRRLSGGLTPVISRVKAKRPRLRRIYRIHTTEHFVKDYSGVLITASIVREDDRKKIGEAI